jgi:vitamin B12 transporter
MKNLSIFLWAIILPSSIFAQTTEDIYVTDYRLPETSTNALVNITSLDKDNLQLHNIKNLKEALELLPGIQFISYGGSYQAGNFYVRGGKAEHVLVLLDGQPLNSVGIAAVNPNIIPINIIERIEYIQGQKATTYGANAISGVINIITKPDYQKQQIIGYSFSSHQTHDFYVKNVFNLTDNSVLKISGGVASSDGYNVHPIVGVNDGDTHGYKSKNIEVLYSYLFDNNIELWASYNYIFNKNDYDDSYTFDGFAEHKEGRNQVERNMFSIGSGFTSDNYNMNFGMMYSENKDYNFNKQEGKHDPYGSLFDTNSFTLHFVNNLKLTNILTFGLGLDYDYNILDSNSTTYGSLFSSSDIKVSNKGVNLNLNLDDSFYIADLSYRLDKSSIYDVKNSYTIGAGIKPLDNHLLTLRYGIAYRTPTLSELYYPEYGNRSLKEEEAENLELFFKGNYQTLNYYVNVFYNKYDDLISYDYILGYANISKAEIKGIQLSTGYDFCDALKLVAYADFLDPKDKSSDKTLEYRSKQSYKADIKGQINQFDYYATYMFNSKRYTSSEPLPGYALLNVGLGVKFLDHVKFYFKVNNLFDKKYEFYRDYNTEGRVLYGGVEINNLL